MQSITREADGRQLVRGGTVEHGRGVYRISLDPDGTPVATIVASTGESLAISVETRELPSNVIDFANGDARFLWNVKRANTELRVQLTHTASGRQWTSEPQRSYRPGITGAIWTGAFGDYTSAYNGDYTWQMTVRPSDGIGRRWSRPARSRSPTGPPRTTSPTAASPTCSSRTARAG